MWKVAIIDDEPIIVEGLSRTLPWKEWGCRIIGTAENGEDGRELIMAQKPDLLFSDICMPGIDGLNMIAGVKSEHPDMEITILTGYRDFEYAVEAIRLGVTRFLLKPSKLDEIREATQTMIRHLESKGLTSGDEENGEKDAGSFVVNNAISYIEENYQNKLKLEDVADHVFVSQWHLSKLLNKYMGQSFSDILNRVRIEKAKKLLRDSSLRVGDVAEQVGFLDTAYFSRVFKKQVGISANEYRNNLPKEYRH